MRRDDSGRRSPDSDDLGSLVGAFRTIRGAHANAVVGRAARVVLAPSVVRVFRKKTNDRLRAALAKIDASELAAMRAADEFERWYETRLDGLARLIKATNARNERILPGYKWGHAAKVLSLFVGELVLHSRYFPDAVVRRLAPWLYAPIDRTALKHLRRLGLTGLGRGIKDIDSRAKFQTIQRALGCAAQRAGVPRVWFDDMWLRRD